MVQLSPITEFGSGAGYEYEDTVILGFAHTNKGHWNLCNIPILPLSNPGNKFGSRFTHKKESSSPGFYQVYLDNYNVNVSLTSTLRCGYHKYEYKNNTNRQILFDRGKAQRHDVKIVWVLFMHEQFDMPFLPLPESLWMYNLNTRNGANYAIQWVKDKNGDTIKDIATQKEKKYTEIMPCYSNPVVYNRITRMLGKFGISL